MARGNQGKSNLFGSIKNFSLLPSSKRAKQEKIDLSEDTKKQCMTIIHGASVACGGIGTGLAQVPLADNVAITPIQVGMIIALGKVFGLSITKSAARGIISGAGAALIGRGVSQVLWGWIPFVGNAINTATAAGLTEAIGWMAVDQFARESANESSTIKMASNPTNSTDSPNEQVPDDDDLKNRIEVFLSGNRTSIDNKEELDQLIKEIENIVSTSQEDDELMEMYFKLLNV